MSLSKHPNVLRVRGTWLEGRKLYIALRLMRAGSISDCMRYLVGDLGVSASLTDEDAHTQGRLAARRVNVSDNHASHAPSKLPRSQPQLQLPRRC
jgi:hypothetical protein